MQRALSTIFAAWALSAVAGPSPQLVALEADGETEEVLTFPAQTTAYDYSRLKRERLGRGLVAWRSAADTVTVSWRYLSSDPGDIAFDLYRDGVLVATNLSASTQFDDVAVDAARPHAYSLYSAGALLAATTSHTTIGYIEIPLPAAPPDDATPDGNAYSYSPGDCSIGDVDGDGEFEIFLKWNPSIMGNFWSYNGQQYYECLKLDGTSLWRIAMGRNILAGEHCSDFAVGDFDGDARAEMIVKTGDGTVDGKGNVIGDGEADWRNANGQVLEGPEYITVFDGLTGEALATTGYHPVRGPVDEWKASRERGWGDEYGGRVERLLMTPAYLDGERLSCVACRGIYKRTALTAWDWDGENLRTRWLFDTTNVTISTYYQGQGFHSLRVADADFDGKDEIIYGSMAVDHDGTPLFTTRLGHGDAQQLVQADPRRKGLQNFVCLESSPYGCALFDIADGGILWRKTAGQDTGRAAAGDVSGENFGCEMWAAAGLGMFDQHGRSIVPFDAKKQYQGLAFSMLAWWTGTLERSFVTNCKVLSYSISAKASTTIAEFEGVKPINGTKDVPCLVGDVLGDWREEIVYPTIDGTALRIYLSPHPTAYRFWTFLEDPVYRISIAHENGCYNQPPNPGFYFGPDLLGHSIRFRGTELR